MALSPRSGMKTVQAVPVPEPQAHIDTSMQGAPANDSLADGDDQDRATAEARLIMLHRFAEAKGDISDILDSGQVTNLGVKAVREWSMDQGTRQHWLEVAEKSLNLAAQESEDDEREPIWEGAANINYPILSTASGQFLARAGPELIKGDKVVGVKIFSPPAQKPSPIEAAKEGPQPQNEQEAQMAMQAIQAATQKASEANLRVQLANARGERIKHYLDWLIFYRMPDWEGDSDLLLLQASIVGTGFKKVYMSQAGLRSDFVSATCLTVHNDTQSIFSCPRITQEFNVYPYEIEDRRRAGIYRNVDLPNVGEDPEAPRKFIEQHRLDDLDGDGLAEPYIVTVDVDTKTAMRIEPAYTADDIYIDQATNRVLRIERWLPFPAFTFLPDPRGGFYGIGLGRLLESITDSVDASMNQLIDAGTAEIAGGGFIGSGVRLQGSGQGGSIFFRPGEYQTVSTQGPDLRNAVWERTVPHPSAVTMSLLEMLLAAAKDIASIKDVITGEAPSTAPVGTTLALQNQALQVFSSIYKRICRGFKDEFKLMYLCLKRWATDKDRKEYNELTGGDFDADFSGDGTDIQPVADPTVVTKMQKVSRMQTLLQLAESPIGMAAGMTQPGPAQALVLDAMDTLDIDRPERFVAPVQPNPELIAGAKEKEASAQLKTAQAQETAAKIPGHISDAEKTQTEATLNRAKTVKEIGETAHVTHDAHVKADGIAESKSLQPLPEPVAETAE